MKRCTKCGETKPPAEFHKRASSSDGLAHVCMPCAIATAQESNDRRRAEMGDEAWRAYRRAVMEKSRRNPKVADRTRLTVKARGRALEVLAIRHEAEFEMLVDRERGLLGLPARYERTDA